MNISCIFIISLIYCANFVMGENELYGNIKFDESINVINRYPNNTKFIYAINFNTELMQATYVYYISTSGGNGANVTTNFRNDPYNINILTHKDYTHSGFSRGHLVPKTDYGYDTMIISNATPMNQSFNAGPWKDSEDMIREKYSGYLIVKGCDYSFDNYIISDRDNNLYIPIGCYYMVFNLTVLPDTSKTIYGMVLDYGYYDHSVTAVKEDRLPLWFIVSDGICYDQGCYSKCSRNTAVLIQSFTGFVNGGQIYLGNHKKALPQIIIFVIEIAFIISCIILIKNIKNKKTNKNDYLREFLLSEHNNNDNNDKSIIKIMYGILIIVVLINTSWWIIDAILIHNYYYTDQYGLPLY